VSDEHRAWIREGISEDSFAALTARLPASRLWSLLLDVLQQRAAARRPAALIDQYLRDRFVQPAYIDQRTLNDLDRELLGAAAAFEAVELSPVAPLGVCSVVGPASQNKILSALRGTEVVSDPTNVMALECARRLRAAPADVVRLATCHRCVRAQEIPKQPGFAAHFRIFCLASAAAERGNHDFLVAALLEHIATMIAGLDRLEQHGYAFPDRRVTVFASAEREAVGDRIATAVVGPPAARAPLEHAYYNNGLRFQIAARATNGAHIPLIDGGAFDWVGKLAANARFVFVASGMGSQLAALLYRPDSIQPPPTTTSSS
jgi:hypothetical protein